MYTLAELLQSGTNFELTDPPLPAEAELSFEAAMANEMNRRNAEESLPIIVIEDSFGEGSPTTTQAVKRHRKGEDRPSKEMPPLKKIKRCNVVASSTMAAGRPILDEEPSFRTATTSTPKPDEEPLSVGMQKLQKAAVNAHRRLRAESQTWYEDFRGAVNQRTATLASIFQERAVEVRKQMEEVERHRQVLDSIHRQLELDPKRGPSDPKNLDAREPRKEERPEKSEIPKETERLENLEILKKPEIPEKPERPEKSE